MRGTSKISNSNSLLYISRNFQNLNKVSTQVALQQQVVDLEDDPLSANVGIKMLNVIAKSEQFNRNIKSGIASLNLTDGFLGSAKSALDKVKTLTTGAANASSTAASRAANAIEMNELLKGLVSAGNAHDGSRYIFGGQNTTTPPFTIVNGRYVAYNGNDKGINVLVDYNTTMPVNSTGTDIYGNMQTTVPSKDMNPDINMTTDHSTKLSSLNGGQGVPKGKITISYSAYPNGLEVDLSGCDTLEDVKDAIEKATLEASRNLDPTRNDWLDGTNLDWRDLQDRYVRVTVNPDNNGISLQEFDLGEPLPEPTQAELRRGLDYSGNPGYAAGGGGLGIAAQPGSTTKNGTTVHDKLDYINYPNGGTYHSPLSVSNYAGNKVAEGLSIAGTANKYDPTRPDSVMDGFLHGRDLNPTLSGGTLLADLEGYNDSVYTFTNGAKPGSIVVKESGTNKDPNNVFNDWKLSGVSKDANTGADGELYARVVNRGTTANPDMYVELYTRPVDKATSANLVATGRWNGEGTTVLLEEANNSGLSGTVGLNMPNKAHEALVDLKVDFGESLQDSVHVPAFVEEQYPNGNSKDVFNIASGWNIRGLDKPPASGYDLNHPASTDLDGNVSVNYRYEEFDENGDPSGFFYVELSRPAYGDQPAKLIATGKIHVGTPMPAGGLDQAVSGRIAIEGMEGFEGVKGSVYLELPRGTTFTGDSTTGAPTVGGGGALTYNPTTVTYQLRENITGAPAGDMVLGGATEFANGLKITNGTSLKLVGDTVFKKGQVFDNDVHLPGGGILRAGTALPEDMLVKKGVTVQPQNGEILPGTVLAAGQELTNVTEIPAGTVLPRGTYSKTAGFGFPADGMGLAKGGTSLPVAGYDLQATFATVEDFQRAVREAGVYVDVTINDKGTGLEFTSSLAGAWLTISESTDGYEQMGDTKQQLTGLDMKGMVKGANTDPDGNVHTEVVYYPPDPNNPTGKVKLHDKSGNIIELEPGYYVRVYKDKSQLDVPYENRDNTTMVAEGFVPAGEWNPAYLGNKANEEAQAAWDYEQKMNAITDPASPEWLEDFTYSPAVTPIFINSPTDFPLGIMENLVLEERNSSGVWGTVDLDYHGSRDPEVKVSYTTDSNGDRVFSYDYSPDDNDGITVYSGGFRPETNRHTTIQQVDLYDPTPGVNCDYAGTVHGKVSVDNTKYPSPASGIELSIYRDSTGSTCTAKSDPTQPVGPDGVVTLYDVDKHGNYLDKAGRVLNTALYPVEQYGVVVGTMKVDTANLEQGEAESFKLTTGAARNTGQEREQNVFATINDIIDAMNTNDEDALHDLLGSIQKDIDRALAASGEISAREKRMELLVDRHNDDIIAFKGIRTSRVGMDEAALIMGTMDFQASLNAYQAAMQVSSQMMNLSLLNYI